MGVRAEGGRERIGRGGGGVEGRRCVSDEVNEGSVGRERRKKRKGRCNVR